MNKISRRGFIGALVCAPVLTRLRHDDQLLEETLQKSIEVEAGLGRDVDTSLEEGQDLWVSLHAGDPYKTGCHESNDPNYSRSKVVMGAAVLGESTNINVVYFAAGCGWNGSEVLTYFGLWKGSIFMMSSALDYAVPVVAGVEVCFAAGDIKLSLDSRSHFADEFQNELLGTLYGT